MCKEKLAQKAQLDTINRAKDYSAEIYDCVKNSIILTRENVQPVKTKSKKNPMPTFIETDIVSAAFNVKPEKTITVLDSAGYKNPGGGYMRGMLGQEETLCHESFLYNVLRDRMDFYVYNFEHSSENDNGYYTDRAIWTPNVRFFHENEERLINVVTCAAPNLPLIRRHRDFDSKKAIDTFNKRIEFVCNILRQYPTDVVIMSAFGCNVFANDTTLAGQFFCQHLKNISSKIIFAIEGVRKKNAFQKGYLMC